jgi:hypothetical protein
VNPNRELEERGVTLGLETPARYEVVAGLKEGELVLIGSRSQVKVGEKIEPTLIGPMAQQ